MRYILIFLVAIISIYVVMQFISNGLNGLSDLPVWIWLIANPITIMMAWSLVQSGERDFQQNRREDALTAQRMREHKASIQKESDDYMSGRHEDFDDE